MDKRGKIKRLLSRYSNWHIVVVGCGGTGSNLVPHLSQLAHSLRNTERISIVLADEDLVEPGNVGRQFFIEPDVGNNKARILQLRYSSAWGVDISYHPHYVRDAETLKRLLEPPALHEDRPVLPVLIGCVDNFFSRRVMDAAFRDMKNVVYIDAGNGEFSGQVVVAMRHGGRTLLEPPSHYFPEIMTEQDDIEAGGTCGRRVQKVPQSLIANFWSAAVVLACVNSVVGLKELPGNMFWFNARSGTVKAEYIDIRPAGVMAGAEGRRAAS